MCICPTDFETSQTKAILTSQYPMNWLYFEHCICGQKPLKITKLKVVKMEWTFLDSIGPLILFYNNVNTMGSLNSMLPQRNRIPLLAKRLSQITVHCSNAEWISKRIRRVKCHSMLCFLLHFLPCIFPHPYLSAPLPSTNPQPLHFSCYI